MRELRHFILTRFNLLLWDKDKEGRKVRSASWLEHRFNLFERYCLPSMKSQTCQDFEWIVLFDSLTPERYKARIAAFQQECPQLLPVYVEPKNGRYFAEIFRLEILKRLQAKRVVTTYLDNDDALNMRFVEDVQRRAEALPDGTFINYNDGYQFYTEDKYLLQIHYSRNHFISVVECGEPATVKGIFGYGSHYDIDKIKGVRIENIENQRMWCEVVHEKNMLNDANFLFGAKMAGDNDTLRREFAVDESVKTGMGIYVFKFLPRYIKIFIRRAKNFLLGKNW